MFSVMPCLLLLPWSLLCPVFCHYDIFYYVLSSIIVISNMLCLLLLWCFLLCSIFCYYDVFCSILFSVIMMFSIMCCLLLLWCFPPVLCVLCCIVWGLINGRGRLVTIVSCMARHYTHLNITQTQQTKQAFWVSFFWSGLSI